MLVLCNRSITFFHLSEPVKFELKASELEQQVPDWISEAKGFDIATQPGLNGEPPVLEQRPEYIPVIPRPRKRKQK